MFSLKVESELKWDTISNLGPFTACPLSPSLIGRTTQQHKDQTGDDEDSDDEDGDDEDGDDEDGDDENGDNEDGDNHHQNDDDDDSGVDSNVQGLQDSINSQICNPTFQVNLMFILMM